MSASYIKNCFIKPKEGDTIFSSFDVGKPGIRFNKSPENCDMIVHLDGYAIVPIEDYKALETTIADLLTTLKKVEWGDTSSGDEYCPGCCNPKKWKEHAEDCPIDNAIAEAEKKP